MIDLRPDHRKIVEDILGKHLPYGVRVWVFGSRAEWTTKDSSDLDLALDGDEPLDSRTVMALELAFEESLLPFSVDVVDFHRVDERFREIMLRTRVVLLSGANGESARHPGPWDNKPLGKLADVRLSSVDKKTVDGEIRVRLCNYTDVYYNQSIHAQLPFMEATATESEIRKCALHPDDVVITKDSEKHDDIGVPALVKGSIDRLVCGYHLAILRPEEGTHGPYLFYALSARPVQQQFHAYANGVTRFGLRKSDIGRVEVPTPPRADQRAIARVLGALDDRIELNRRMNTTLEAMARALFKSWFVDFDPVRAKMEGRDSGLPRDIAALFPDRLVDSEFGEVPEGWMIRKLGQFTETTSGRSYKSDELVEGETALVTLKSFRRNGGYRPDGLKPYRGPYKPEQVVKPGEIVVACTDVTQAAEIVGRSAVVQRSRRYATLVASLDVLILRPNVEWMKHSFLGLLTSSHRFVAHTHAYTTGTTVLHLQKKSVSEFAFAVPPAALVRWFDNHVRSMDGRLLVDSRQSEVLSVVRDTLLPRLVSGEVRVPAALVPEAA